MADKDKQARRVSFASEPQINYICTEEYNSTRTSSSINEVAMDLTTTIPEFKTLTLFKKIDTSSLNDDIDAIFGEKDAVEYVEDPVLVKEYDKRRNSLSRRPSLNPIELERDVCDLSGDRSQNDFNVAETEKFFNTKPRESLANNVVHNEIEKENIVDRVNTAAPLNDRSRKISLKEGRRSIEGSFNDSNLPNSSFAVEEIVNTVDLRKIVQHEKKEDAIDICEFLSSIGIRFIDDVVANGMRRDTLSKSRNVVDPSLILYYKYSVKERIDYFSEFSAFLANKMCEMQEQIEAIQQNIVISTLNKENLKKIRNESRNRSKTEWYFMRKSSELKFNKKILENKVAMTELLNEKKRQGEQLAIEIAERETRINALKSKMAEMNKHIGNGLQCDSELNVGDKFKAMEKIQQMINDRKAVFSNLRTEGEEVSSRVAQIRMEESLIDARISELKKEIAALSQNLMARSVSEDDLDVIKKSVARYETIFNIRLRSADTKKIVFEIHANEVTFEVNDSLQVTKVSVDNKDRDPFVDLLGLCMDFETRTLSEVLGTVLFKFSFVACLKREISLIKQRHKIEMFFVNQVIYLRIYKVGHAACLDLSIDKLFNLKSQDNLVCNLLTSAGELTEFIEMH